MADHSDIDLFYVDGAYYAAKPTPKYLRRKPWKPYDLSRVTAFIPGLIREVSVSAGQQVTKGQRLCVLEAMKMKNDIIAPRDGVVRGIAARVGDIVPKGALLIELEP